MLYPTELPGRRLKKPGVPGFIMLNFWWSGRGSNPRPSHCERDALPTELPPQEGILTSPPKAANLCAGNRRFSTGDRSCRIKTDRRPSLKANHEYHSSDPCRLFGCIVITAGQLGVVTGKMGFQACMSTDASTESRVTGIAQAISGLLLFVMLIAGCVSSAHSDSTTSASKAKISPELADAARQLESGDNATPLRGVVRSDNQGRIQVYVYVVDTSTESVKMLAAHGLQQVLVSSPMHIVQGWIMPQNLEKLAALPFVSRITPPHYGFPHTQD
jgi:hypothetical protein